MRVLWIATKSPWPPRDGGRLLLLESLRAVAARGVEITLVAPVGRGEQVAAQEALRAICEPRLVVTRQRARVFAALAAVVSGRPYSLIRHVRPEVARVVARELASPGGPRGVPFDVVVAEQLQAFAQSAPGDEQGRRGRRGEGNPEGGPVPRILRAQNVESDLWRQLGLASHGIARSLLLREAGRLARAERAAMATAAATIALSAADGERLRNLGSSAGRGRLAAGAATAPWIEVLPPPFPGQLATGDQRLDGRPALVLFGSAGWEPNRRGELHFVDEIWPRVYAANPGAVLHWFGGATSDLRAGRPDRQGAVPARPGVRVHRSPATSAEAFSPGAILVLPLDIASGVRMRVLEAWARGIVLVASPAAASGLDASDGRELLLAKSAAEYVQAIERLSSTAGLADRLIAGGRARLATDHAPERFAERFMDLVERLAARGSGAGRR